MDYNNRLYTLTYYFSNFSMHLYDLFRRMDFSYIDKSVKAGGREPYYATPFLSLINLKRYIVRDLDDGREHSVIDIGCGKGFMLYFFSHFAFKKVSGIEYDKRLSMIARHNLKRLLRYDCVRIYNGDATRFKKYSEYNVFYLYNPFDKDTLSKVISRIMCTLEDNPRTLYLFYCNPLYEEVLIDYGFEEVNQFYYKTKVYIYE